MWYSNICAPKVTFPFLALLIASPEVKEEPWDVCCYNSSTAVLATKKHVVIQED